jgi:hypothetical protein
VVTAKSRRDTARHLTFSTVDEIALPGFLRAGLEWTVVTKGDAAGDHHQADMARQDATADPVVRNPWTTWASKFLRLTNRTPKNLDAFDRRDAVSAPFTQCAGYPILRKQKLSAASYRAHLWRLLKNVLSNFQWRREFASYHTLVRSHFVERTTQYSDC